MTRFLITTLIRAAFSKIPAIRQPNPYLNLSSSQLSHIILQSLAQKQQSVEYLNTLIRMGIAAGSFHSLKPLGLQLISESFNVLKLLQHDINEQREE